MTGPNEPATAPRLPPFLGQVLKEPFEVPIQGHSMRPLIHDGDVACVLPFPRHPIRVGDVVLFRREAFLVAHRVVAMKAENGENLVAERGDNAGVIVWRPEWEILGCVYRVRSPRRTIDLNGFSARLIGRIMSFYWKVFRRAGRPKRLLVRVLEAFVK